MLGSSLLLAVAAALPVHVIASSVAQVGDIAYYVPDKVEVDKIFDGKEPRPITVVTSTDKAISAAWLNQTINDFKSKDDVYSDSFSSAFYFQGPEGVALADDAREFFHNLKPRLVEFAPFSSTPLPDGPYFATRYGLHRAWRLYDDFTNSFTLASVPSDESPDVYEPLAAKGGSQLGGISVAVPSRLFYTPTPEKPLAGYRVAVKDEYEINGLVTTYGSRAYAKTYPPANQTSGVIQSLIDQGAIIVGKTKLSLFAGALFTASEWTDYELPINVRADTYQIPGASSAGSGSSMAAYDWLDNTVGEDTGGSMRFPSALNGVFGIRSSLNSTNNTATHFGPFDAAGHFARDVDSFNTFGSAMYRGSGLKNYTKFPTKILYPREYWVNIAENYTAPGEEYVQKLEAFLGVNRTIVDTNKLWLKTSGHGNASIADYFENNADTFANDFKTDYFKKFGIYPYMSVDTPGTNSTEPESDAKAKLGKAQRAEFQAWYRKYILASNDETCSETIVVFPFNGNGGVPWYRDATTKDSAGGFATAPEGYLSWNMLSVLNGSPELAVPVGEVGYTSKISLVEEKIPAALEIQAAYGCDIMLLNLVRELAYNTDATKRVKTGRFMF
ncbi:Amidase [Penicillium brevicompactum]|uniref:Amidase n=1 Tax=Penicillium brevicompactum TaxID=5074 RepID=UPI00253FA218|nr:Amidase [Penicillium brevicompactum]KAJ5333569.1 Amidase [Penicillium brevicompactum]